MAVALTALGNVVALIEIFFRPIPHVTPTFIVERVIHHEIGATPLPRTALAVAVGEGDAVFLSTPAGLDEEIPAGVIREQATKHWITITTILSHVVHRNRKRWITLVFSLLLVNHTEHRTRGFVVDIRHTCQSGPIKNASTTTVVSRGPHSQTLGVSRHWTNDEDQRVIDQFVVLQGETIIQTPQSKNIVRTRSGAELRQSNSISSESIVAKVACRETCVEEILSSE